VFIGGGKGKGGLSLAMKRTISILIVNAVLLFAAVYVSAEYVLDVAIYNGDDDTPAPRVEFPGIEALRLGDNLWIASPQYIRVRYTSEAGRWSIRIVTKNSTDIGGVYPRPLATGRDVDGDGEPDGDDQWEWERLGNPSYLMDGAGNWQVGDDVVSYGGLINEGTKLDPNSRATLAWQVYRYNDPYYPVPALNPSPPPTALTDATVGGGPTNDWAYIADAGDTGYVLDPINNYFWVAYGSRLFSLLAQHPVVYRDAGGRARPKPGGGDCFIYVGARFGRRATDGVTDIGVLPAGDYNTTIYLELIHW